MCIVTPTRMSILARLVEVLRQIISVLLRRF
jgi:hypothetical protein